MGEEAEEARGTRVVDRPADGIPMARLAASREMRASLEAKEQEKEARQSEESIALPVPIRSRKQRSRIDGMPVRIDMLER